MASDKDLDGRSFLVTGANTGIGRVTAIELARRGGTVTLAGRSEERTRPVLDEIAAAGGKASFLPLDLGDLASTARAAKAFLDSGARLDVLVNNAGIAGPRGLTKDGFEVTFGTNHVGPFLFTTLLLPRIREGAAPRIVNVASHAHYRVEAMDWDALRQPTRSISAFPEYGVSKLCNVLFTKELARGRAGAGVHSYSLHPGAVASDIWRRIPWPFSGLLKLFLISNEQGALTSLHCATSPDGSITPNAARRRRASSRWTRISRRSCGT
jgi:NAD(P)-dependent dehydrogenase (short-subunit alcohol dehydrogenase family)